MANFDWLKTLSKAELAEFLDKIIHAGKACPPDLKISVCKFQDRCYECWLDWLTREHETEAVGS